MAKDSVDESLDRIRRLVQQVDKHQDMKKAIKGGIPILDKTPAPKGMKLNQRSKPKPQEPDDDLVPNDPDQVRRIKKESKVAFNRRQKKYGVEPV